MLHDNRLLGPGCSGLKSRIAGSDHHCGQRFVSSTRYRLQPLLLWAKSSTSLHRIRHFENRRFRSGNRKANQNNHSNLCRCIVIPTIGCLHVTACHIISAKPIGHCGQLAISWHLPTDWAMPRLSFTAYQL